MGVIIEKKGYKGSSVIWEADCKSFKGSGDRDAASESPECHENVTQG